MGVIIFFIYRPELIQPKTLHINDNMRTKVYDSFDQHDQELPWSVLNEADSSDVLDESTSYEDDGPDDEVYSNNSEVSDTNGGDYNGDVESIRKFRNYPLCEKSKSTSGVPRGAGVGFVGDKATLGTANLTESKQPKKLRKQKDRKDVKDVTLKGKGKGKGKKKSKGKGRKYFSKGKKERTTWEPGIDVATTTVFLNSPGSVITITDYSKERFRIAHYDLYSENDSTRHCSEAKRDEVDSLEKYLSEVEQSKTAVESAINQRPDWSNVRWINVNGLSWEAISIIGRKYELHPLSVEDLIDIPQRTKIDIYPNHLFMILPLLRLFNVDDDYTALHSLDALMEDNNKCAAESDTDGDGYGDTNDGNSTGSSGDMGRYKIGNENSANMEKMKAEKAHRIHDILVKRAATNRRLTDLAFIKQSKRNRTGKEELQISVMDRMRPLISKRLAVGVEQAAIYVTSEGTVISFFERSANEVERAILSRLTTGNTKLRETANATTLFHSIVDTIVDMMYPVMTAYTKVFNEKELEVLTSRVPDFQHTQQLHVMLNELGMLKNMMSPISALVLQLKDLAVDEKDEFVDKSSKLYLSDINDHLLSFIDEINSMSAMISNLIDLIFNTLSVDTNNSMQQLSLVTVLFLPLTFWAGFFGMNFTSFPSLHWGDTFFWELSIPFTAVMMALIMHRSVWILFKRIWRWWCTRGGKLGVTKKTYHRRNKRRSSAASEIGRSIRHTGVTRIIKSGVERFRHKRQQQRGDPGQIV